MWENWIVFKFQILHFGKNHKFSEKQKKRFYGKFYTWLKHIKKILQ